MFFFFLAWPLYPDLHPTPNLPLSSPRSILWPLIPGQRRLVDFPVCGSIANKRNMRGAPGKQTVYCVAGWRRPSLSHCAAVCRVPSSQLPPTHPYKCTRTHTCAHLHTLKHNTYSHMQFRNSRNRGNAQRSDRRSNKKVIILLSLCLWCEWALTLVFASLDSALLGREIKAASRTLDMYNPFPYIIYALPTVAKDTVWSLVPAVGYAQK